MEINIPDISFVVLTWNSVETIGACLDGLARQCRKEEISYEALVADNGSTDGTRDVLAAHAGVEPVRVIPFERNVGTTITRNAALRECQAPVICVLDSDTVFQEGRIRPIFSLLADRGVGIVGPRLVLADGTVQNSVKRHPSIPAKLLKVPRILLGLPMPDLDFYPDFPFEGVREVETAISACWFLRKDLLGAVGFLDERIFYPTEDIDYCLRVRQAGFRILYSPCLTVLHHTRHLTHRKPLDRMTWIHLRSLAYYFWKHRYAVRPDLGPGRRLKHPMRTAALRG